MALVCKTNPHLEASTLWGVIVSMFLKEGLVKESTKEWLGIKPADFIIYSGFVFLIPAFQVEASFLKFIFVVLGFSLCLVSCKYGMPQHSELNRFNNLVKKIAYPIATFIYLYLGYLSFS